jgi:class 3 adenylate cyclase
MARPGHLPSSAVIRPAPPTRYARAGDVHLAYQRWGAGPHRLVLVWGTMSHVQLLWDDPATGALLEKLGTFAEVVQFDKRGTGLSDRDVGAPTLEERMDDVRAVMDAVGWESATILGESEGGAMSLLFAATAPERVTSLVLYAPLLCSVQRPDWPHGLERKVIDWWVDWALERWGTGATFVTWAPNDERDPDVEAWLGRFEREAMSPGAFRAVMRSIAEADVRELAKSVQVPTLLLHRTDDRITPVGSSRWLAENLPGVQYVEVPGEAHYPGAGDTDRLLAEIEHFITGVRPAQRIERVLRTVLFTDIVDSTARAASVGDSAWRQVLERHDRLAATAVDQQGGTLVKSTGDGMLATFEGPARAVIAARAFVEAAAGAGLAIRAGLHTGEIELHGDDVAGIAVHLAARVAGKAASGQVLVSRTVRDLVAGSGLQFADHGTHELKGFDEPWQLYAVESV